MRIEEPEGSRHINFKSLGNKLTPSEARQSPLLNDFFLIADYAIDDDPAVLSYLSGEEINIVGRVCKHRPFSSFRISEPDINRLGSN